MDITGAGRWRQGANACIFKPAVSCENQPPLQGHLSRVVKLFPAIENRDVKYETFIKEKYPELVEKGLVSVYTRMCSPKFTENDNTIMPGFPEGIGGCSTIVTDNSDSKKLINLITPIQGLTLNDKVIRLKKDIGMDIFDYLRPVFSAAIALVPDNGNWLINMDLHGGNILTNKNTGLGMMSDWDQSLILTPSSIVDDVNQQILSETVSTKILSSEIKNGIATLCLENANLFNRGDTMRIDKSSNVAVNMVFKIISVDYEKNSVNIAVTTERPFTGIAHTGGDVCLKGDSKIFEKNYYQWWAKGVDAIKSCKKTESLSREEVNTLRVWTIRTVFINAIRYSKLVSEKFNSEDLGLKLKQKIKSQRVRETARLNIELLDQILIECNTQSEISNTVQHIIQLIIGDGLSQLVGGKTRRRRLKKN